MSTQDATAPDCIPAPTAYPGETFLSTWSDMKFFLSATDSESSWASLASFYGYGRAHLSTCRLVFVLEPCTNPSAANHLSIPLSWLRKERLEIRRPFFDSKHLSGILIPADVGQIALDAQGVFAPPGNPMEFRIEMLDSCMNDRLCGALHDILSDPDRVAKDTRVLREAVDKILVPTDIHYAFVDPTNPTHLHLATQMTLPDFNESTWS